MEARRQAILYPLQKKIPFSIGKTGATPQRKPKDSPEMLQNPEEAEADDVGTLESLE